ncbi:MAG: hypothetical protein HQL66_05880 [Magnetococcales bacterium]|nr:hypothetical protein [Magnetococcales bacterium]
MQSLIFVLVGVALYLMTDRLIEALERRRGARFEYRSVIFFLLILMFSLVTFQLIERFVPAPVVEEPPAASDSPPPPSVGR